MESQAQQMLEEMRRANAKRGKANQIVANAMTFCESLVKYCPDCGETQKALAVMADVIKLACEAIESER